MEPAYIQWIDSHEPLDANDVGSKGYSLGRLRKAGLRVPDGFVVTTAAFQAALPPSLISEIEARLKASARGKDQLDALHEAGASVGELVYSQTGNHPAHMAVSEAYARFADRVGDSRPPVAVRSSSLAEDSQHNSFAGEYATYLWVTGPDDVGTAVRRCWASLFTPAAMAYRVRRGLPIVGDAMAVVVQQMVNADVAGVFMTLNPANGDRSKLVIESVWGLGQPLVDGEVTPDRFVVDKVTSQVLEQVVVRKRYRAVRNPATGSGTGLQRVDHDDQTRPSLTSDQLDALIEVARAVEAIAGAPQDAEFALVGDLIYMLQARPETVWAAKPARSSGAKRMLDATAAVVNALTSHRSGLGRADDGSPDTS